MRSIENPPAPEVPMKKPPCRSWADFISTRPAQETKNSAAPVMHLQMSNIYFFIIENGQQIDQASRLHPG